MREIQEPERWIGMQSAGVLTSLQSLRRETLQKLDMKADCRIVAQCNDRPFSPARRYCRRYLGRFLLRSAFQPIFAFEKGKLKIAAYEGLIRPFEGRQSVGPGKFFASIGAADRFRVETLTRTLHVLNAGSRLGSEASLS
jgi:EAL domain-containing protein (putative c-di-GMP-specific phosphodiesterase class I)